MKGKVTFSENGNQYDYVGVNRTSINGSNGFKKPLDSNDLCNNPMYSSSEDNPGKEIYSEVTNTLYEDTSGAEFAFGKLPEKSPGILAATDVDHTYETPAPYLQSINSQAPHDINQDYSSSLTAENPLYGET